MALIICPECGNQFSDKASHCPKCGAPAPVVNYSNCGKLTINWKGKNLLLDSKVRVNVNGNSIGEFSFINGFTTTVPITTSTTSIQVKGSLIMSQKTTFELNPSENYTVNLAYRGGAGFGFVLLNEAGEELINDVCPTWLMILAFCCPLLAFILAYARKSDKTPAAFRAAIGVSIYTFCAVLLIEFLMGITIMGFFFDSLTLGVLVAPILLILASTL